VSAPAATPIPLPPTPAPRFDGWRIVALSERLATVTAYVRNALPLYPDGKARMVLKVIGTLAEEDDEREGGMSHADET